MAGPQVQHTQRPNSAYYTGLNGSGGSNGGGGGSAAAGMASSASHTGLGLHALRQVSNETELIYRGGHSNGTVAELPGRDAQGRQVGSSRIIQQQPGHSSRDIVSSIAGTGSLATDALIGTIATSAGAGSSSSALAAFNSSGGGGGGGAAAGGVVLKKSSTQRSIEIIVDATQCGKEAADADDLEQGDGGGQESSSTVRKSSRHRHRPLHRRLITYLRNLFQGSDAANGKQSGSVAFEPS